VTTPTSAPGQALARELLAWMGAHGARLRTLLAEEAERDPETDLSPAGEPAIRAYRRLVAEALAAGRDPEVAAAAARLGERLPILAEERRGELDEDIAAGGEALAFEVGLQLGAGADADPSTRGMVERRARVMAWLRFFLARLDDELAPAGREVAAPALAWMGANQSLLSVLNHRTGHRVRQRDAEHGGLGDEQELRRVAQAAMLQAHVRFLVEALGAALARP
jgi:hypothetical protein